MLLQIISRLLTAQKQTDYGSDKCTVILLKTILELPTAR